MGKKVVYTLLLQLLYITVFAQPPIQKFWALNQPHYIYMNGSTGWQINTNNVAAGISGRTLTLTTNSGTQASSAFYMLKMGMRRNFTATFTYTPSGNQAADGVAFVIQNAGTTALGATGQGLGYQGITPSIAVCFNLYTSYNVGIRYVTGGVDPSNGGQKVYASVSPVILNSGNAINVTITYNYIAQTLAVSLAESNTTHTYSASQTNVNIPTLIGSPIGWVGFTGATGGSVSTQTITNFVFQ